MNDTELEDELRETYRTAAETVPVATDLGPQATASVRRERRSWAVSGAAVVAVVAAVAVGTVLRDGNDPVAEPAPVSSPSTSAPQPTTGPPVTGEWRPARIAGFRMLKAPRPTPPVVVFDADGTWSGSDGCNSISGNYSIGPAGELTMTNNGQRLAGCQNVPHVGVFSTATRLEVSAHSLRFFGPDGRELATYHRSP